MKRVKRLGKRILSMCLCISLLLGMFPMTVMAENAPGEITTETLEGLAEPTVFPAEGTMHLYVMNEPPKNDDLQDVFSEKSLSVIVNENKTVFAKLSELRSYLDMRETKTSEAGREVRTLRYHNSVLILKEGDSAATYTKQLVQGNKGKDSIYPKVRFSLGTAPMMYKEEFYVPIDAFLKATESFAFYSGDSDTGKQDLYIIAPQRTVMDDLINVYEELDTYYAFSFEKDFGRSAYDEGKRYNYSEFVQLFQRWGKIFDGAAWSMIFAMGDVFFDDKYIDIYMDHVLHCSEEVLDGTYDKAGKLVDAASVFVSLSNTYLSSQWKNPSLVTSFMMDECPKHLEGLRGALGKASDRLFVAKNALRYMSISASLYGVDRISANGANIIRNYPNYSSPKYLDDQNRERIWKNVDDCEGEIPITAFGVWVESYWMSNAATFAKYLTKNIGKLSGILGLVSLASSIWSGGTSLLFGTYLNESESFMAASLGIRYQAEIIPATKAIILNYIYGAEDQEEVRSAVYHTLASCYVARYLGCMGMESVLENYQREAGKQKQINQNIMDLMVTMQCSGVRMGMKERDFGMLSYSEEIHYDHVYFNVCQVQGRIHNIESGKPEDNLDVWVTDENGTLLAEFKTDRSGDFDISFPVDDIELYNGEELQKQITFHIKERWYPEILLTADIPIYQKVKVNGLWAGELKETINCYLEDANEENGKVILNIRRIDITQDRDKMVNMQMPTFFTDDSYQTYVLSREDCVIYNTLERIVLDDNMTFETIYAKLYPDGTWAGEFMQIFTGASPISGMETDALINSDMHNESEIYDYITQYKAINEEYPTFEINKSNSEIKSIEPTLIEFYN